MFQLMENAYSQEQHVEMNDQSLEKDRIYIAVGFLLDSKKQQRD